MEWVTKHKVKVTNIFCKDWEPTRARTNKLNFWEQDEKQSQKWKILDHIAVPIRWVKRSTIVRNCRAPNVTNVGRW